MTAISQPATGEIRPGTGERVALIGVGSMGLGMAQSLVRAGFSVAGYDADPAALGRVRQHGIIAAASATEAATDAGCVVTAVVNDAQTRSVLFQVDKVAAAMKRGGVIISSATMSPDAARSLAVEAEAAGVEYLDAPVSGGPVKSALGQLTIMISGRAPAIERARPALAAMAATIYELGTEAGAASAFKIVNQLLAGVHIAAACEAMLFARRLGLDLETVYKVITASAGNSWMFENRMPHVLAGDYQPLSATNIFVKDLGIASDLGRSNSYPMPLTAAALQMFVMTAAAGMGKDDDASIARLIARITGLTLPGETEPGQL